MIRVMVSEITLGKFKLNHLISCQVRKDVDKLSDSATIKLPGMAYGQALEIESKIKRGDAVTIKLGYEGYLFEEFNGFISSIATDNTIIIECEDSMFLTRKEVENKQYQNTDATAIIQDVINQLPGIKMVAGEGVDILKYDKFTINEATGYDVLKKIKEETGLHIFMKGTELHVYLQYTYNTGKVKYDFAKNVQSSNLKYLHEADKKVLVEVVGIDRENKKVKVEVGEKGGDKITVHRYNVHDPEALKKIGEEEIIKHRFTGYEGDFTTWLLPYITTGASADMLDPDYVSRQGVYYTSAVTTTFDKNGGKRKVVPSIKVA